MPEPERLADHDADPQIVEQPAHAGDPEGKAEGTPTATLAPGGAHDEWDSPAEQLEPLSLGEASRVDQPFETDVLEIVSSLEEEPGTAEAGVTEATLELPDNAAGPVHDEAIDASLPTEASEAAVDTAEADAVLTAEATPVAPPPAPVAAETSTPRPAPDVAAGAEAEAFVRVPWWPFAVYLGLWVIGLGAAAYLLMKVPSGQALYEQQLYGYVVIGGLALTALGPLLIPVVWLLARGKGSKEQRVGLFSRTAFWGSLATLLGVALWWGTLVLLDTLRLGRPL